MEGTLVGKVPDLLVVPTAFFVLVVAPAILGLAVNGAWLFVHIASNAAEDRTFHPRTRTEAGQPLWLVIISVLTMVALVVATAIGIAAWLGWAVWTRFG